MIDFSFVPSPFRSVRTQKEKPSLTSRGFVSDGFLFSMPFGFYSKLYIFDYDRDFVSFNAAKVRILFETRNSDKYTLYILYIF